MDNHEVESDEEGEIHSPVMDGNVSPIGSPPGSPSHYDNAPQSPDSPGGPHSRPESPSEAPPYSPMARSPSPDGPASPDATNMMKSPGSPSQNALHSPSGSSRSPNDRFKSPPASPEQTVFRSPKNSPGQSQIPETQTSPTGAGPASPDQNDTSYYNSHRSPDPSSPGQQRSRSVSPVPETQTSPTGAGPQSPPGSPHNSEPRSPIGSPIGSPIPETQTSPTGAGPDEGFKSPRCLDERSRSPTREMPMSPNETAADDRAGSPIPETQTSPTGAGPADRSRSPPVTQSLPTDAGPESPTGGPEITTQDPQSPNDVENRPQSPNDAPQSPADYPQSPLSPPQTGVTDSPERPPMSPPSPPASPLSPKEGGDKGASKVVEDDDDDLDLTVVSTGKKAKPIEDDDSDKESAVGELIADIFGSSDDDDEEFEGFGEADVENVVKPEKKKVRHSSETAPTDENEDPVPVSDILPDISDDDLELEDDRAPKALEVSDFDVMMEKRKALNQSRRRRKRDEENITANDDLIDAMVKSMKEAAEKDRMLNENKKAAISKLKYLPHVSAQLKKADLHGSFLDCGILNAMTEWLAPLPDRSLPHLHIREVLLRALNEFPSISSDSLKTSGVGKAIMYLYKHPRESRENREIAGKLINEWSRPIFNLTSNFKLLSKEEREQRDYEQLPKKRRISSEDGETPRQDIDHALTGEERALRPGDPGWIMRARVPIPSNKDYVVRPKWNIEEVHQRPAVKKKITRYEKHKRAFAEKKKKVQNILSMSIEGRHMDL